MKININFVFPLAQSTHNTYRVRWQRLHLQRALHERSHHWHWKGQEVREEYACAYNHDAAGDSHVDRSKITYAVSRHVFGLQCTLLDFCLLFLSRNETLTLAYTYTLIVIYILTICKPHHLIVIVVQKSRMSYKYNQQLILVKITAFKMKTCVQCGRIRAWLLTLHC